MTKRIVSVWLPRFETDLIARREPRWRTEPLALYRETGQRLETVAVNAAAEAEGVRPGMTLADARALLAGIATRRHAPERRARALKALTRHLDRFAPLVAVDGDDGFFLETTGTERLFGAEAPFLDGLVAAFAGQGLTARAAIAGAAGAAWALARFGEGERIAPPGEIREALAPLPAAALRLPAGVAERLARLGLRTIGDLYALPRATLVRRFGVATARRLDQALGAAAEPISPVRPPAPYRVELAFAEPLLTRSGIEVALDRLLEKLETRLALDERGATRLTLEIRRVDGGRQEVSIGAAAPTRDADRLARLFAEKLDALDPGFGVEAASLAAPATGRIDARQGDGLAADAPAARMAEALAGLVDTLGARLGAGAVRRFAPEDGWRPDRSWRFAPPTPPTPAETPAAWPAPPGPRPLELLARPAPIQVEAPADPLAPPRAVWRAGARRTIRHAVGPERIEPEWRAAASDWPEARDYWRAEDEGGCRLWLYRQGTDWFLHGRFA